MSVPGASSAWEIVSPSLRMSKALHSVLIAWFILTAVTPVVRGAAKNGEEVAKTTVGWLEVAHIEKGKLALKAKLDTGAQTTSIHTPEYKLYEKDGQKRVSFTVSNKKRKKLKLDKEIVKMTKIKEHNGAPQMRPVVKLTVKIGTKKAVLDVNLVDRSNFLYPLLVGRKDLVKTGLVIDPSLTYTLGRKPFKKIKK